MGVGILTDGWNLADAPADPDIARSFVVEISFATHFNAVPVIQLGLTGYDTDNCESGRISLKAGHISAGGFQVEISTWSTTRVYAVEFNWLAIGA